MSSRKAPTFYVLHGEDEYSIKSRVDDFRRQMGDDLNITDFDGTKASVAEVLSAVCAIPFLADRRLVVVQGMLSYLVRRGASEASKKQLEQLVKELPTLPESARLVFVELETLKDTHPVIKVIHEDPAGYEKAFNPPKDPSSWIRKKVAEYKIKIDERAVAALVAVIENDLRKADNELFKLAGYVGEGGTITEKDVSALTTYVGETDVFGMVDALGQRDGKKAMGLIHNLLDVQRQEPLQIFGMIVRQFRLLIQAREIIDDGGNATSISQTLSVHSFVAKKLSDQARGFTLNQLERIYRYLLEMDVNIKTGKIDSVVALDLFVAGIAGG